MSWMEINVAGLSEEMEQIPEGNYVFSLLAGAKYNQWDKQKIDVAVKVDEGEFKGRVTYLSFPDPAKQSWSPQAMRKFTSVLEKDGASALAENQDPVEYLNQEDVVGHRFVAPLVQREYEKDGEKQTKTDIRPFKVRPVTAAV